MEDEVEARIKHLDHELRQALIEMLSSNQPVDSIVQLADGYYAAIVALRNGVTETVGGQNVQSHKVL